MKNACLKRHLAVSTKSMPLGEISSTLMFSTVFSLTPSYRWKIKVSPLCFHCFYFIYYLFHSFTNFIFSIFWLKIISSFLGSPWNKKIEIFGKLLRFFLNTFKELVLNVRHFKWWFLTFILLSSFSNFFNG